MKRSPRTLAGILALLAAFAMTGVSPLPAVDTTDTKFLTKPAVSAERVAFVYADDLWTADLEGRNVRRLTSGVGTETNPSFSPDGRLVAFSGQYDGNIDVYVVPAGGGVPKRLTWHPAADIVLGFTPDGQSVLFASGRFSNNRAYSQLFTVPVAGGEAGMLKIPYASDAEISPGRPVHRLLPLPGGLHPVEELPRRPLLADLDLQRQGPRRREAAPARRALERRRPDVGRREDRLPLRPQRRVQSVLVRSGLQGDQAADGVQGLSGPLGFGRGRPDRLRTGRRAPSL